jgi:hypothetical protein
MENDRKVLQDINSLVNSAFVVNEGAEDMKKKIEKMADVLADKEGLENVPRANIVRALTNMVKAGDSLEDTEAVEQELHQMYN